MLWNPGIIKDDLGHYQRIQRLQFPQGHTPAYHGWDTKPASHSLTQEWTSLCNVLFSTGITFLFPSLNHPINESDILMGRISVIGHTTSVVGILPLFLPCRLQELLWPHYNLTSALLLEAHLTVMF